MGRHQLQESQKAIRQVAQGLLDLDSQDLPASILEQLQNKPPPPPSLCICMPMTMMQEIVHLAAKGVALESGSSPLLLCPQLA